MRRHITEGEGLPRWSSPVSHAVVVGHTCYLSGQLALDAQGELVPGSAADEARLAFRNLFAALAAAGFARGDLVFVDVALIDLADLGAVNAIWRELFAGGPPPARTVYQAAALPFGGKVKVMGVAMRDESLCS